MANLLVLDYEGGMVAQEVMLKKPPLLPVSISNDSDYYDKLQDINRDERTLVIQGTSDRFRYSSARNSALKSAAGRCKYKAGFPMNEIDASALGINGETRLANNHSSSRSGRSIRGSYINF